MADDTRSLRTVYTDAEKQRKAIESSFDSNSATFQENLTNALRLYEQCIEIASRISLFSPNETLEDIASADLQYLLLRYRVAELCMRVNGQNRKATITRAQRSYEEYLKQLDRYEMLSKSDADMLELFQESPNTFSTAATTDPSMKRDIKIRRFKEEKALRQKLEQTQNDPSLAERDDDAYRELQLTNIAYCTHQTFQSLESIGLELHILSLAPPSPPPDATTHVTDSRDRDRTRDAYSDRLDSRTHLSAGLTKGPLLDPAGKPLRPFTLTTSKRQDFRDGVFRPDHSLPTMSIDEYLEEERKRGGMIEGGGEASGNAPLVDEDDFEAADRATMKARDWDEYVEANPKGSGNTLNRG